MKPPTYQGGGLWSDGLPIEARAASRAFSLDAPALALLGPPDEDENEARYANRLLKRGPVVDDEDSEDEEDAADDDDTDPGDIDDDESDDEDDEDDEGYEERARAAARVKAAKIASVIAVANAEARADLKASKVRLANAQARAAWLSESDGLGRPRYYSVLANTVTGRRLSAMEDGDA